MQDEEGKERKRKTKGRKVGRLVENKRRVCSLSHFSRTHDSKRAWGREKEGGGRKALG